MKRLSLMLAGLALCASATAIYAQETAAAPAAQAPQAEPAAADTAAAVRLYHSTQMYRTYLASAEMLDDPAYDNDVVAGAAKLLEIAQSMPTDGLPDSYKAYLKEKNDRQAKNISQIKAIMCGRTEEELTIKDLKALQGVLAETETEYAAISAKYPEAEAALGDDASQAFSRQLDAELQLSEKTKQYLLEHPEVAAGGQEAALSASMRFTASILKEYLETLGK